MRQLLLRPVLTAAAALLGTACFGDSTGAADTTAPVVVITAPTDSIVRATVQIAATVLDDTGIANVVFSIDGHAIGEDPLAPYQFSWNTPGYPNGTHQISVTGIDVTGKTTMVSKFVAVANGPD